MAVLGRTTMDFSHNRLQIGDYVCHVVPQQSHQHKSTKYQATVHNRTSQCVNVTMSAPPAPLGLKVIHLLYVRRAVRSSSRTSVQPLYHVNLYVCSVVIVDGICKPQFATLFIFIIMRFVADALVPPMREFMIVPIRSCDFLSWIVHSVWGNNTSD